MDIVYSFLSSLYGDELHDFLLDVNGTNMFKLMALGLFIISALAVPWFYYKGVDRATWASRGKWFMMLLVNAAIVFVVNVTWVSCLESMMTDEDGEELAISTTNIIGFGAASAILASILFFLASLLVWKRFSTNCTKTPF